MLVIAPIAYIRSCYTQRFGIPRQAGLVQSATAQIVFEANEANKLSLRDVEQFSHLWVIFWFHGQNYGAFKSLVSPPRLGGSKQVGVYATRSPNRPNPIGLSAVALEKVEFKTNEILVHIRGGDLLDGTPVLDLKPYIPYADLIPAANGAWAVEPATVLPVAWSAEATQQLEQLWAQGQVGDLGGLRQLIIETLVQDPRPAYERQKDGQAGQHWDMQIERVDVRWQVSGGVATITRIIPIAN